MATETKRFKLEDCPPSKVILLMDLVHNIPDRDIVALFSRYGNVVDMLRLGQGRSALVEFDDISVSTMMVSESKVHTFFVGTTACKMAFGNSANIIRKKGEVISSLTVLGYWPHPNGPAARQQQQQPPIGASGDGIGMAPMASPMQPPPPQMMMMMQQQSQAPMMQQQQVVPVPPAPSLAMQGLPGRVLLFSITNAIYPITVDVMKAICSPNGNLLRVSIGQKKADNSLEALVEFENVADANKAIESLNGADIYSGCCTLAITVSHLPVLQVYKNDTESCDFTNPNLGVEKTPLLGAAPPQQQVQHQQQMPPHQPQGYPQHPYPAASYQMQQPPPQPPQQQQQQRHVAAPPEPWMFQKGEGTVIMAYNLPPGLTCQNIFNIVCLYGNVARVKFLKSREGCAMVQMGTPDQCGYVVENLSGLSIYGQKVEVCRSKQPEVQVTPKPDMMENGTPISMCYEDSINNRFKRPDMFTKSRLVAPTRTLHFFNFPAGTSESDVLNFFMQNGGPRPDRGVVFKAKLQEQKAAIGLVEFDTVENAVLALMRSNHAEIRVNEKTKFHAKLSFSTKPIDPNDVAAVNYKLQQQQQQQQQQPLQSQQQQQQVPVDPSAAGVTGAATISKPATVAAKPNNGVASE